MNDTPRTQFMFCIRLIIDGFLINFSKSISSIVTFFRIKREVVDDNLRNLVAAVSNEMSVEGIRFQARYSPILYLVIL